MANYKIEFPDFGALDVALPAGAEDISWKNEACPCFSIGTFFVYVDYADPALREFPESARFSAHTEDAADDEDVFSTDDWAQLLIHIGVAA